MTLWVRVAGPIGTIERCSGKAADRASWFNKGELRKVSRTFPHLGFFLQKKDTGSASFLCVLATVVGDLRRKCKQVPVHVPVGLPTELTIQDPRSARFSLEEESRERGVERARERERGGSQSCGDDSNTSDGAGLYSREPEKAKSRALEARTRLRSPTFLFFSHAAKIRIRSCVCGVVPRRCAAT